MNDTCDVCGKSYDTHCRWHGPPFSIQADKLICHLCLTVLKPKIVKNEDGIEFNSVGTHDGSIQKLSEIMEQGFEKKEAIESIKAVGKALKLSANEIKSSIKG